MDISILNMPIFHKISSVTRLTLKYFLTGIVIMKIISQSEFEKNNIFGKGEPNVIMLNILLVIHIFISRIPKIKQIF